ncbi:MAG: ABC transporter ATP-binding protein [Proteobacteria bacterium]|nr:ABC transporter ATP-binding protein [Pseudomonadota bacterium]
MSDSGTGADSVLECRELSAGYGRRKVLKDLSLRFARGRVTAVVGPNGCGKSTLLRVLAGLMAPNAGAVWLGGHTLQQLEPRERARQLAWLAQTAEVTDLTARDMVSLGRFARTGWLNQHDGKDEAAVARALEATGALHLAARRVARLSGGERQRVSLARVLAVGASVLLLDEPTSHLDPPHQLDVLRTLRSQAHGCGATIIAVIHDLSLALMADELVVMGEEGLVGHGSRAATLAGDWLSRAFGTPISVVEVDGMPLWRPHPSGPGRDLRS